MIDESQNDLKPRLVYIDSLRGIAVNRLAIREEMKDSEVVAVAS